MRQKKNNMTKKNNKIKFTTCMQNYRNVATIIIA